MSPDRLRPVFERLKAVLQEETSGLDVTHDTPDHFELRVGQAFFGSAVIGKNYVSYHLMPVYDHPELLQNVPDDLRRRMQGKSCFNFRAVDEAQLQALARLTRRAFALHAPAQA